MCQRVKCDRCGKPSWVGCGLHVEQALRGVPPEERCQCPRLKSLLSDAFHEVDTYSSVRKARAAGASDDAMLQVLALAATTIGFPATVAAFTWVREETRTRKKRRRG